MEETSQQQGSTPQKRPSGTFVFCMFRIFTRATLTSPPGPFVCDGGTETPLVSVYDMEIIWF